MAGPKEREDRRAAIDHWLATPLDPDDALEYERELFGETPDAIAAEESNAAFFGDASYGE